MDQWYVWSKKGKAYEQKNTISMVKNGCGPVLLWRCFAVVGSGNLDYMKDIMNSLKYQAHLAKIHSMKRCLMINRLSCRSATPKYTPKST